MKCELCNGECSDEIMFETFLSGLVFFFCSIEHRMSWYFGGGA